MIPLGRQTSGFDLIHLSPADLATASLRQQQGLGLLQQHHYGFSDTLHSLRSRELMLAVTSLEYESEIANIVLQRSLSRRKAAFLTRTQLPLPLSLPQTPMIGPATASYPRPGPTPLGISSFSHPLSLEIQATPNRAKAADGVQQPNTSSVGTKTGKNQATATNLETLARFSSTRPREASSAMTIDSTVSLSCNLRSAPRLGLVESPQRTLSPQNSNNTGKKTRRVIDTEALHNIPTGFTSKMKNADICLERGRGEHEYREGNRLYKRLVSKSKETYCDKNLKPRERAEVISSIMMAVKRRGGWFVEPESRGSDAGTYMPIERVRKKISDDFKRSVRRSRKLLAKGSND